MKKITKKPKDTGAKLFGQAITQIMAHKGVTGYQLGEDIGVPNAWVYRISSGKSFPSFRSFFKLSKALGYKRPDNFLTEICNIIEFLHKKGIK